MKYAVVLLTLLLSGCGTFVPKLSHLKDEQIYTRDVHIGIQCEIIDAIYQANIKANQLKQLRGNKPDFFKNWGLLYTVTLSVVEDSNLKPSIDLLSPTTPTNLLLPGNSVFTLNTGLNLSAKATRNETDQKFATVENLRKLERCENESNSNNLVLFGNNLGLSNWLLTRLSLVDSGIITSLTPKESFTYEVKFEIGKRGNIDPKWSFIQRDLSKVTGMFNSGRTSSHSVLFTFGPVDPSRAKLEQNALAIHSARLISNAID